MSQANCLLDTGIARVCKSNAPGNVEIYIGNFSGATSYTTDADNLITGVTSMTPVYKFEFPRNTAGFVENIQSTPVNDEISYQQVVSMVFNKRDVAKRNLMLLLAKATTVIIIKDSNGLYTLVGKEVGCDLSTGLNQSGVATGDRNGYEFEFTTESASPAAFIEFDAFSSFIDDTQI